jgi:enoyl-CoA hydratase
MNGAEAAECGFVTRAFPTDQLETGVLEIAERVAKVPAEVQQFNKRSVHRAMELMGMRNALRAGTELQALAAQTEYAKEFFAKARENLTQALTERDEKFGDYRTKK